MSLVYLPPNLRHVPDMAADGAGGMDLGSSDQMSPFFGGMVLHNAQWEVKSQVGHRCLSIVSCPRPHRS